MPRTTEEGPPLRPDWISNLIAFILFLLLWPWLLFRVCGGWKT